MSAPSTLSESNYYLYLLLTYLLVRDSPDINPLLVTQFNSAAGMLHFARVRTSSAAAASSGDAPIAQPTAQPMAQPMAQHTAAGLLLTTSGRLNYEATHAPPPAAPDDVQPNVGQATMPSLRATPVLDCYRSAVNRA